MQAVNDRLYGVRRTSARFICIFRKSEVPTWADVGIGPYEAYGAMYVVAILPARRGEGTPPYGYYDLEQKKAARRWCAGRELLG